MPLEVSSVFASRLEFQSQEPRHVVEIDFGGGNILAITSHTDITWSTGTVHAGLLRDISNTSQEIIPEEARATISSSSFEIVDKAQALTTAFRTQLASLRGLRGKTVRFYSGESGFTQAQFTRIATQVVSKASIQRGVYKISCQGIVREVRIRIFDTKKTTLSATIDATTATIPAAATSAFLPFKHGSSYSLNPGAIVGYARIKQTGEIFSYTSTASNQFGGCVRGLFGTLAKPVTFDGGTPQERRPEIEEVVYLEMPGPKLIYALLTGVLLNDSANLPSHWHCGIATSWVRLADFTGIDKDLWDSSDDSKALQFRFVGEKGQEAKRFIESEILRAMQCYQPEYTDGTIGIRRLMRIVGDSAPSAWLSPSDVLSVSSIEHGLDDVENYYEVNWNYNGSDYTRGTALLDTDSITINGKTTKITQHNYKGLYGSRVTANQIEKILDAARDRYASPPIRLTITTMARHIIRDVGELIRLQVPSERDFSKAGSYLDRTFEIQRIDRDWRRRRATLKLFGSTGTARPRPPQSGTVPLLDAFYTAVGTNLTSISGVTVSAGVLTAFPATPFDGGSAMNVNAAVLYYNGDLTIGASVLLKIKGNVQLRIKGFLTINGTIDGKGQGLTGTADPGTEGGTDTSPISPTAGQVGFIGATQGSDGIQVFDEGSHKHVRGNLTNPAPLAAAPRSSVPELLLGQPVSNQLVGLPAEMRGTSGGPGGRIWGYRQNGLQKKGSAGGNSGAGLTIICRGLGFGASGKIDLSGSDGAAPVLLNPINGVAPYTAYPGAGDGGHPGACYILLDGDSVSLPDLTGGKFVGLTGVCQKNGNNMTAEQNAFVESDIWPDPKTGANKGRTFSARDVSPNCYRVQYLPAPQTVIEDPAAKPPMITALTATGMPNAIAIQVTPPPLDTFTRIKVLATTVNNRADASASVVAYIARGQDRVDIPYTNLEARYFWAAPEVVNDYGQIASADYFPASATAGIFAQAQSPSITPYNLTLANVTQNGGRLTKTGGTDVTWGDAQAYSQEGFSGGCVVSFKAGATNKAFMVGLNTDPATDASYTSIDFAWFCIADGTCAVYESGATVASFGSYTTSTQFELKYDGAYVYYLKDGVEQRRVPAPGRRLYLDSSFYHLTAAAVDVRFGSSTATRSDSVALVARGNCVFGGDVIEKLGGSAAWDSDVYSVEGYYGGAFAQARPGQTTHTLMFGLNSDPVTDQSYASLDYAWYCSNSGALLIYESGSQVLDLGASAYTVNTLLAVLYNGAKVEYLRDGVVMRAVAATDKKLFFDCSLNAAGGKLLDVRFGPYGESGVRDGNFLNTASWLVGSDNFASIGNFLGSYSNVNENHIVLGGEGGAPLGPYGTSEPLWECRPDGGSDGSGGFVNYADCAGIDSKKSYRVRCWVRKNSSCTTGQIYLGCDTNQTRDLAGGANTNPYFCFPQTAELQPDQWYLLVGVIHGETYSGSALTDITGVYDPRTGRRLEGLANGRNEFRMAVGAAYNGIRCFPYYVTQTAARIWLSRPYFELMDGREASLAQLLAPPDADNTALTRPIPDGEFRYGVERWQSDSIGRFAFLTSGGLDGGVARITFNTTQFYLRPVRVGKYALVPVVHGSTFRCRVRWRRIGTVTTSSANYFQARIFVGDSSLNMTSFSTKTVLLDAVSPALNAWQEIEFGFVALTDVPNNKVFLWPELFFPSYFTGGQIEIDQWDIFPGEGLPRVVEPVSGTVNIEFLGEIVSINQSIGAGSFYTVAFPQDSTFPCPIGSHFVVEQTGSDPVHLDAGTGATLQSPPNSTANRIISGRYGRVGCIKTAANTWRISGDLQ